MRGTRHDNIVVGLTARQIGQTILRRPFAQVLERLQIPVDSIIDEHEALKGAIILGWTHSGNYLISYTSSPVPAADGAEGHHLQLWSFHPFQRAVRQCNVPLFSRDSAEEGDEWDGAAAPLLVTVCAAPDDSILVVHGEAEDENLVTEAVCHVTAIPLLGGGLALEAIHFDYQPLQATRLFRPQLQAAPPGMLVLSTAGGVVCFQLMAERVQRAAHMSGADSATYLGRATTTAEAMFDNLAIALSHVDFGSSKWLSAQTVARCRVHRPEGFQLEPFVQKWMLGNLPGHQLTDFDVRFAAMQPPAAPEQDPPGDPASGAAASEYDFIGSDDDGDHNTGACRTMGSAVVLVAAAARKVSAAGLQPTLASLCRVVCLLIDIDLATGTAEVLSEADATPRQHQGLGFNPAAQQLQPLHDVRMIGAAHAMGWQRRFAAPRDVQRTLAVLTNLSVLATGRSAARLIHPWLPMCLTGYSNAGQG